MRERRCFIIIASLALFFTIIFTTAVCAGISDWQETSNNHRGRLNHDGDNCIVDPIKTEDGYVSGTMIGDVGNEVRIYRGIPYAAPPVGDLRWRPPQPPTPWEGIRECTKFSLWAAQAYPVSPLFGGMQEEDMGEDCLYLNVLTPAKTRRDRLPVMVWLHGGGLVISSGNFNSYNTAQLPQHGVVLVTVSHRLSTLGYMAHPELTAESPHNASGNYGQLDIVAALQWVRKNIAAFGGDPHRVTIFGESGGGSKTLWLMSSPLARGLFQRAICQSGGSTSGSVTLPEAEEMGLKVMEALGVSTLAEMRTLPWQAIIDATRSADSGYTSSFTVDQWSLPADIYDTFAAGDRADVPFMIGLTENDVPLTFSRTLKMVTSMPPGKSPAYTYLFTKVPSNWSDFGLKAYHGLDVAYVFGTLDKIYAHYGLLFPPPEGMPADPGIDETDEWMADAAMTLWARFAAKGDPSVRGLIEWPPYDHATDQYLDIGDPLEAKSGFSTLAIPE